MAICSYRANVLRILPQLKKLDNIDVTESEVNEALHNQDSDISNVNKYCDIARVEADPRDYEQQPPAKAQLIQPDVIKLVPSNHTFSRSPTNNANEVSL